MMERNNGNIGNNKENKQIGIQANICYASGTCGNCHWFDGNYHGGWCDKHRCDVQTYSPSCNDYWPE